MKSLPNKRFLIGQSETSFKDFAKACVNHVGQGGVSIEEQRKRIRLLDALEKSAETVELEDADAEQLKSLVEKMVWAVVLKEIVEFGDAVKAL